MSERRMFAKTIIDSDAFIDMPLSTQALYFHLSMRADDDGFVNNPKKIQRMIGASDDDFKVLVGKRFLIPFESGIVVIKHWRIHNYIQKDRYKETVYLEEKNMLKVKDNKAYTLDVSEADTECIQDVSIVDTQVSIDKDSIGKVSIDKTRPMDEDVEEAFESFKLMREQMDKPLTKETINMLMENLEVLSGGDKNKAVKIIKQSVLKGWKGFYPLKEDEPQDKPKARTKNKFSNFEGRKYTDEQILEMERAFARG